MSILANKAAWLAAFLVLCMGLAAGLVFGFTIQDADAARRPQLKTLRAVVEADGDLVRGKGVTLARKNNTSTPGIYQVFFNRNVSNCAYVATTADGFAGDTGVEEDFSNSVKVYTNDVATAEDLPFHLVVTC
jgi:hypothetical protein